MRSNITEWFDEVDYLNDNAADFVKVLWREFAKTISLNTPFWWMDLQRKLIKFGRCGFRHHT